jgi:hypothetical protein
MGNSISFQTEKSTNNFPTGKIFLDAGRENPEKPLAATNDAANRNDSCILPDEIMTTQERSPRP